MSSFQARAGHRSHHSKYNGWCINQDMQTSTRKGAIHRSPNMHSFSFALITWKVCTEPEPSDSFIETKFLNFHPSCGAHVCLWTHRCILMEFFEAPSRSVRFCQKKPCFSRFGTGSKNLGFEYVMRSWCFFQKHRGMSCVEVGAI